MPERNLTLKLDEDEACAEYCHTKRRACRFLKYEDFSISGMACVALDEHLSDGQCGTLRHPDCVANEKTTAEIRDIARDMLGQDESLGHTCHGEAAKECRRRLGL